MTTRFFTFGHGTLGPEAIAGLLHRSGIEMLVDVRTAPGSRRHPHVARQAMERWLPEEGIAYRWDPRLGGWRKPDPGSANRALRNDSFRGYADYMNQAPFWEALDELLRDAISRSTTVMCSEAVYWRCHRRLLADAAVIGRGAEVLHLGHDGRLSPHRLTDGVRDDHGRPLYDLGVLEL